MKAEKLISMASARGIDMIAIAQQSTAIPRKDTISRTRCGVRMTQLQEQPERRAYGKETRAIVELDLTGVDAGFALAGLAPAPTLAAFFAWAGHTQHYWPLVVHLRTVAMGLRKREHWPEAVENDAGVLVDYIEPLCEMVLFEDGHPSILDAAPPIGVGQDDQAGILRAIFCEVTLPVWKRHLEEHYTRIYGVWLGWLDSAARLAQSRLRENEV